MNNTIIDLSFDEWCDTYKPIVNTIGDNPSFEDGKVGIMFETYGDEHDFVVRTAHNNPFVVWTYLDGDNGTCIVNGYNIVNRIGYFITEVPFDGDTTTIVKVTEE